MHTRHGKIRGISVLLILVSGPIQSCLMQSSEDRSQFATLEQTIHTSLWSPPSPDPSGIVYIDNLGQLIVVDSEVNETPLFTGDNFFITNLNGILVQTLPSTAFTGEPTGISFNPFNEHLYISTDNRPRRIIEVDPGLDENYATADDIVTFFNTTLYGSFDAEGVTFNRTLGLLHSVDGDNSEVYTIHPGTNGVFDGSTPEGDDIVTSFDTAVFGITDPEGIAYDADFGHLYLVGRPSNVIAHVSIFGQLLRMIDITTANPEKPAGLTYAPSSSGSGTNNLYLVDRGVDNDADHTENDGKIYELYIPPFSGNNPPAVSISIPADDVFLVSADTVEFSGTAIDSEDGDLSSGINWTSSLDNGLGQGASISISSLTVGSHVITALVTDSGSMTAINTIIVDVH